MPFPRRVGLGCAIVATAVGLMVTASLVSMPGDRPGYFESGPTSGQDRSVTDALESGPLQNRSPPILVGTSSSAVTIDASAGKVYVANEYDRNVTVISASTYQKLATLNTRYPPTEIVTDPQDGAVFALGNPYFESSSCENSCPGNGTVDAFSTASNAPIGEVSVGNLPVGIAFSEAADELFVANTVSSNLSVISPHPFALKATLAIPAYQLIADPTDAYVYAIETGNPGNVTILNGLTNSVAGVIHTGGDPFTGVFNPWNRMLYIGDGNATQNWVDVVSTVTNQLITKIGLPGEAFEMVVDSLNGDLLVGSDHFSNARQFYGGNFSVISPSTNAVLRTFVWSPYVYAVVPDNATGAVYVLGFGNLTVFNATTLSPVYRAPVNESAYLMALSPTDDTLWVVSLSYYIGTPGSVVVYAAPLPTAPPAPSSGILGETNLVVPVVLASVVAGVAIGMAVWRRSRDHRS